MMRTRLATVAMLMTLLQGCAGTAATPAHAFDYVCENGRHVRAVYLDDHAHVTYGDKTYTMEHAISADGARYVGSNLEWWTRGDGAMLSRLEPAQRLLSHCRTQR